MNDYTQDPEVILDKATQGVTDSINALIDELHKHNITAVDSDLVFLLNHAKGINDRIEDARKVAA